MNTQTKWIVGIIVLALVVWGVVASTGEKKVVTDEPIKIGFVGSFSGDLVAWGEEAKNSFTLAVEEINTDGGVGGRDLVVIYEDGECKSSKAVTSAQKLIDIDKVDILVSYCSQEALSVAPVAEENRILHFAPAATVPELTNIGKYTFRTGPSDRKAAETLAKIVLENHERVAILTENNDFPRSLRDTFVEGFSTSGERLVFDELYESGVHDYRTPIVKIKLANPDAVLVNTNSSVAAGLIIKQIKELGLDVQTYGVYYGSDPEFIEIAGNAAEGFTYLDFTVDSNSRGVQKFLSDYRERFGNDAPHPQFATLSYNAPYILREAIEAVGVDSDDLVSYLNDLEEFDGVFGLVEFDGKGEVSGSVFKKYEIKNGKPVLIESQI